MLRYAYHGGGEWVEGGIMAVLTLHRALDPGDSRSGHVRLCHVTSPMTRIVVTGRWIRLSNDEGQRLSLSDRQSSLLG